MEFRRVLFRSAKVPVPAIDPNAISSHTEVEDNVLATQLPVVPSNDVNACVPVSATTTKLSSPKAIQFQLAVDGNTDATQVMPVVEIAAAVPALAIATNRLFP
jgi:hypothetical protein